MDLTVETLSDGTHVLRWHGGQSRCAIGRSGILSDKHEGDGATPVGAFLLRRVLYRPDRVPPPVTALPVHAIAPDDGWCDDPSHPDYNRPVKLPFAASHERMWLEDAAYDVVVVIGHNDDPPVPGLGSAIFLHVSTPDWQPTAGCVAVPLPALLAALAQCGDGDALIIRRP